MVARRKNDASSFGNVVSITVVKVACILALFSVATDAFTSSFSSSSSTRRGAPVHRPALAQESQHSFFFVASQRNQRLPYDQQQQYYNIRNAGRTAASTSSSLSMSVEGDFDPEALNRARNEAQSGSLKARLRALYKFTRPHTIRGTILASIAGTTRALIDTPGAISSFDWGLLLPRAFIGMVALLLGNAFIVGINQIYDKDIDVLNKPFLPVASGEMSKGFAWLAVIFSGVVGPVIVKQCFPPLLFKLYAFGMFLGGIYSVPPIRTKRNPILAGLTIATVRGFLLNFGVYYAVKDAIGGTFSWSPRVAFIARFMTCFATVIAVTKDLPDVEGDKAFQIETIATKIGVGKVAKGASICLFANYVHAILTGLLSKAGSFNKIPMIGGHVALATMLLLRFRQLEPDSIKSVKLYYKHIWDLFYLEYVLYTLI